MHVLAASDKFRGTASAPDICQAIARAALRTGATCKAVPVADGGEGTLDALGGANRRTVVSGPLGDPVEAGWRLSDRTAIVEMAQASGLMLLPGGADGNDPLAASTYGTGELIAAAVESGARRVIIGVGGSATTDGGLGALRALFPLARLRGVKLIVACDVRTRFVDAARVFGPQKGATAPQVELLTRRLERLADMYLNEYGVDVRCLDGAGAAGGLAGGLSAVGAELVNGFEVVADELDLAEHMEQADLVVTGEGFLDEQSFEGKVVGGVVEMAEALGIPVLAVAGEVFDGADARVETVSLVARFGRERALGDAVGCVEEAVYERLSGASGGR